MNSLPAKGAAPTLDAIRAELALLQQWIPPYAPWRAADLRGICERYSNILRWLASWDSYRLHCEHLLLALPQIQAHVADTLATGNWQTFSQAATALEWDLSELIGIIS